VRRRQRLRSNEVAVHRSDDRSALMTRRYRGFAVTGVEPTLKTRRLLVAHGIRSFVRESPLTWNNRRYLFDFGFERERTILETNGRRWHDDPNGFEHDNEKWSVPGRHGFRIVLATWDKVTRHPGLLLSELTTTLAADLRAGP
jgi:very-short-patch-repair endonuclease